MPSLLRSLKKISWLMHEMHNQKKDKWHHEHRLIPTEKGVLMADQVTFRLPLCSLGTMARWLFVKKQFEGIFRFRESALEERFGRH